MANHGMNSIAEEIEAIDGYNPEGKFQIGEKDPNFDTRTAVSEMKNSMAVDGMRKNGPFSQIIAHGILNWIYSMWNEEFRSKIGVELGWETNDVMCDVMGDIRLLRNFIVHDGGIATSKVTQLKVLTWIKEGPLVLLADDMTNIQEAVNTMSVYKRDGTE